MYRLIKKWKTDKIVLAVALFFSFTLCTYAPLEMYLGNADEFWFRLSDIWWLPVLAGASAFLVISVIGIVLPAGLKLIYESLVFGGGLAVYLQGNFLNLDLGIQNGSKIYWQQYQKHFIVNLVIWGAVIITPVILTLIRKKVMEKVILFAGLMLTAMQLAALLVLAAPVIVNTPAKDTEGFFSDVDCFTVSEEDNIIVFLLDMFDDAYFKEIIKHEPTLREQLYGFTQFTNSAGNYSTTLYSIYKLMTGEYFRNEENKNDWLENTAKGRLYLDELAEQGYEMGIYTYEGMVPSRIREMTVNYENATMHVSDYKGLGKDLYKFVTNKYLPDIVKPKWWMTGTEFDRWKQPDADFNVWYEDNNVFYDRLKESGISTGEQKQYKFIHLNGAHYPYENDEYGNRVETDSVSAVQCARGALQMVMNYMNQMKDLGVYDKSSIIIMADHGYYYDGVLTNPVLLAKPREAKGDMTESSAPVSHDDFRATIMSFAGMNDNNRWGNSVFEIQPDDTRNRVFYQYYLSERDDDNYRLIEYSIDDTSNEYDSFHLTDVEYTSDGKKIRHSKYCALCRAGGPTEDELKAFDPPRVVHQRIEGKKSE